MVQILATRGSILSDASKLRLTLNKYIYTNTDIQSYLKNKVESIFINGTIDFSNMTIKASYPNRMDVATSMRCILSDLKGNILEVMKQNPEEWSENFEEILYIDDLKLIGLLYETLIFNNEVIIKL